MITRLDKILLPIVTAGILALGIATEAQPEVIQGKAHAESGSYFNAGEESAQGTPVPALTLPEWAPEEMNDAPAIHFTGRMVFYADGTYLWIAKDGTIYQWQITEYNI